MNFLGGEKRFSFNHPAKEPHPQANEVADKNSSIIVFNNHYRILWNISHFANAPDQIVSNTFTHTNVKIQFHLFYIQNGSPRQNVILRTSFLQFPCQRIIYKATIYNMDNFRTSFFQSMFLFENGVNSQDVQFPNIFRDDLTEINGWLKSGSLCIVIDVMQPPKSNLVIDDNPNLQNLVSSVSFLNNLYSFKWDPVVGRQNVALGLNCSFESPEFRCGTIGITVKFIRSPFKMEFHFKTRHKLIIKMKVILNHQNQISNDVKINHSIFFNVESDEVTPKENVLTVTPFEDGIAPFDRNPILYINEKGKISFEFEFQNPLPAVFRSLSLLVQQTPKNVTYLLPCVEEKKSTQLAHNPTSIELSQSEIGFNGLTNTSSRSGLNAVLQILFHIPIYRQFIFNMTNTSLGIRKLFAMMQLSHQICSSKKLFKEFNLSETQNDSNIHEMFNLLFKSYGGVHELGIPDDSFDIPINVDRFSDLNSAIKEIDEKYFQRPIILFNLQSNKPTKLRDIFAFPEAIFEKELFAVVVHSGFLNQAYVCIKPFNHDEWIKFNDSVVKVITKADAISGNFGGFDEDKGLGMSMRKAYSACYLVYIDPGYAQCEITIPEDLQQYVKRKEEKRRLEINGEEQKKSTLFVSVITEDDIKTSHARSFKDVPSHPFKMNRTTTFLDLYQTFGAENIRLWCFYQNSPIPNRIIPDAHTATLNSIVGSMNTMKIFAQNMRSDETLGLFCDHILILLKFFNPTEKEPVQFIGTTVIDTIQPISALFPIVASLIGVDSQQFLAYRDLGTGIPKLLKTEESFSNQNIENASFLIFSLPQIESNEMNSIMELNSFSNITDNTNSLNSEETIIDFKHYFQMPNAQSVTDYYSNERNEFTVEIADADFPDVIKGIIRFPACIQIRFLKKFIAEAFRLDYNPELNTMILRRMDIFSKKPSSSIIEPDSRLTFRNSPIQKERIFYQIIKTISEDDFVQRDPLTIQFSLDAIDIALTKIIYVKKNSAFKSILDETPEIIDLVNETKLRPTPKPQPNNPAHFPLLQAPVMLKTMDSFLVTLIPDFENSVYDKESLLLELRFLVVANNKIIDMKTPDDIIESNKNQIRIEFAPNDQIDLENAQLLQVMRRKAVISDSRSLKANTTPFLIRVNQGENFGETKERIRKTLKMSYHMIDKMTFRIRVSVGEQEIELKDNTKMNQKISFKSELFMFQDG